jgi:hypothetical protein
MVLVTKRGGTWSRKPPMPSASPRTATVRAVVERFVRDTGLRPSVEQVAKELAIAPERVRRHFEILGLS